MLEATLAESQRRYFGRVPRKILLATAGPVLGSWPKNVAFASLGRTRYGQIFMEPMDMHCNASTSLKVMDREALKQLTLTEKAIVYNKEYVDV